jgi:nitroreductase
MDFDEVARTTFACREFTSEPVADEVLHRVLDVARFAPNGGNRQGWRVVVVRQHDVRRRLAELCQPTWNVYMAQRAAGEAPWSTIGPSAVDEATAAARHAPNPLLDNLTAVPVVLVIGIDLSVVASMDRHLDRIGVISGASIYPFVWHLLLAARNEGLGGTITTFLAAREPEAQELLGFPDHVALAALVPLGWPVRQLRRLSREPVEAFTTLDRYDGSPFSLG